jgi:LPS-assembly lipoprotein
MRATLAALALLLLAACGFQLRGTAALPFESIHLPGSGDIVLELRRSIQSGSRTAVLDDPKRAQALLEVMQEERQKEILSLTADGRVREFRLLYRVEFRVHDGKGGEYVRPAALQTSRDMTYSDTQLLAKEAEEQLHYRDMQQDMVQQIMRRMAGAQAPQPAAR